MKSFLNSEGALIVHEMILAIQQNKQYLSDIDGAIGDGDHGINMNKGFTMCETEMQNNPGNLSQSLNLLSKILMMKIGGSMGPLYGKFFKAMAKASETHEIITISVFDNMLGDALQAIQSISTAKVGDKTLMDTLVPAVETYSAEVENGSSFEEALDAMSNAARAGMESTKDLMAKIGRSSRLGERSIGVLDAGAISCFLILDSMAASIKKLLN
jgi:phosphoenolpyruvate---glycerone phosphotransferase subunit DhaL